MNYTQVWNKTSVHKDALLKRMKKSSIHWWSDAYCGIAGVTIHWEARRGWDSNGRPRGQLQSGHGLEFWPGASPAPLPYWLAAAEEPRCRRAYNLTALPLPFLFAPPSVEWWWCLPELGSVQDHAKLLCQDPGSNNVMLVTTVESKEACLTRKKFFLPRRAAFFSVLILSFPPCSSS